MKSRAFPKNNGRSLCGPIPPRAWSPQTCCCAATTAFGFPCLGVIALTKAREFVFRKWSNSIRSNTPKRCGLVRPPTGFRYEWVTLLLFVAFVSACKDNKKTSENVTDTGTESACPWDTDNEAINAGVLANDATANGFVCPRGDEDWYAFAVPPGHNLLSVRTTLDAPVSPLNLVFTIWDGTATNVVATLGDTQSIVAGTTVSTTYFLAPGSYFLQVRDKGNDGQDVYHPYALNISTFKDADGNEPNNSAENATAITGSETYGYISYDGDEDWYQLMGIPQGVINIQLTMPISDVSIAFRIVNTAGEELASEMNSAGTTTPTSISYDLAIDSSDIFYVIVSGVTGDGKDKQIGYSLTATVHSDPDSNENNDHPTVATPLQQLTCSANWSEWTQATGYIASSGDVDWFRLNIGNCSRGVVEVELTFANPQTLPQGFSASLGLVREVQDASCTLDQECQVIPKSCSDNLGCAYLGNSCLKQGMCAGAGTCLPSGFCGANWAVTQGSETAPATIHFSAPLQNWSDTGDIYFSISDTMGKMYSTSHAYTFKTRIIADKDANEISGAYSTRPQSDADRVSNHLANAVVVPVHDCTQNGTTVINTSTDVDTDTTAVEGDTNENTDSDSVAMRDTASDTDGGTDSDTAEDSDIVEVGPPLIPGCCGPGDWVEGYLSYQYDEDWYAYPHPCPGGDCMVRVLYDIGAGPVDTYVQIFEGQNAWYDNLINVQDAGDQISLSGTFGGTDPTDTCFYGYKGHIGSPFWYYLSIRDTIYVSDIQPRGGSWDWSPTQPYRFCIEKVATGCQTPCQLYDGDDCGPPQ